jgi:DNA-binding IclR family transcriptional regulator
MARGEEHRLPTDNLRKLSTPQRLRLEPPPSDHVQSLMRGLRILEYVHAVGRPVAVRDVAEALELNVSTTHHLVNTLVWEGYLVRAADRRLVPGRPAFATSGGQASPRIRRALGRAAYAADDVAVLARLDGGEAYIAATENVPGAASAGRYPAGARGLAHLLAVGRVLLAFRPPEEAAAALERTRALAGARGEIFDEEAIRADLERIRAERIATLVNDAHGCVAAPVFGPDGECEESVAIVVSSPRMRHDCERLIAVGRSAGRAISAALAEEALHMTKRAPRVVAAPP